MAEVQVKEIRVLVPKQILDRAKKFYDNGLYERALELLERNKMVFEIHDTFMTMQMPDAQTRAQKGQFSKHR